ncbi:MAG TPA: serine hydrolase [Chloroflexota bacterium]|jgi:CubicO group peptidase (beta-lactamase class C family)
MSRTNMALLRVAATLPLLLLPVLAPRPAPAQDAGAGRLAAALAQLDGLAAETLQRTGIPGMAVGVVSRDQVVYLKGFGGREAGTGQAVDADTVFQLASVSKPIASTVVAALVGDGVARWDDRIIAHDPGFQMYDPWVTREVTLRDMFAHRSGLPDHAGDLLEDLGYDRAEVLHRLRYQRPDSSFRSTYNYTNFGLTEAAVAAARAAGESWEDLSAERLYLPLGMTATSSRFADFAAAPNRALLHVLVDGRYVPKYVRQPDAQSPAGGVSSTVRDLAQWMRLQLGGGRVDGRQIITADALAATHVPQIVSNPPKDPAANRAGFYGLGWNVGYDDQGRVRWSHSGGFASGAATAVYLVPAEQLGIVVLTNAAPIGAPEALAATFLDLALEGRVTRDWAAFLAPFFAAMAESPYGHGIDYTQPPPDPRLALPLASYVGTYANDLYGDADVALEGDGLVLRLGPARTAYPLWHYDGDVFAYQPVGENAYSPSGVIFQVGPSQTAGSVTVENLDLNGQGTFTRPPLTR